MEKVMVKGESKQAKASLNTGDRMIAHLVAKGKKARKRVWCGAEELATAAGVPYKQAFDRLWWMEVQKGVLVSKGKGKERVWALKPAKEGN